MLLSCFLRERKNTVAALCIFSLIIVKSLQFGGRRQIAEPRKYCLMRVIVFLGRVFFSIYFVSHKLEFWLKFPTDVDLTLGLTWHSMNVTSVNDTCLIVGDTVTCEKIEMASKISGITMILLLMAVVNCMEARRQKF